MRLFGKMIHLKFKITALAALTAILCPLIAGDMSDCAALKWNITHFAKQQTKNIRPYFNNRNNFFKIKFFSSDSELPGCYRYAAAPELCFSLSISTYKNSELPAFKYAVWSRSTFV
ncbi:MAG: hypothetical protein V1874_09790 [Spirochaetota bacterium]